MAFVLGVALYMGLLQWCYIATISPIWSYARLTYETPPTASWVAFSLTALVPALWMPLKLTRPSQWLYLYLYLVVFVPLCFVPLFQGPSIGLAPEDLSILVGVLLVCFAALGLIYRLPLIRVKIVRQQPIVFWIVIGISLIAAFAVLYSTFGSSMKIVGLEDIKGQRLQAREVLWSSSDATLVGYCMNLPAYGISPLLMALGIWSKKPLLFLAGLAGEIVVFSLNATRGALGTAMLILLVGLVVRQKRWPFMTVCVYLLSAIVFLATVLSLDPQSGLRLDITAGVSRLLVCQSQVTGAYYKFFDQNPKAGFSHIRGLGWLPGSPYGDKSIAIIIGTSMGDARNNANANLWADGFASAGFLGMALMTLMAMAVFHALDSASRNLDPRFAAVAVAAHGMTLADVPIYTVFLGSGLGLLILLLAVMPDPDSGEALWKPARKRPAGLRRPSPTTLLGAGSAEI